MLLWLPNCLSVSKSRRNNRHKRGGAYVSHDCGCEVGEEESTVCDSDSKVLNVWLVEDVFVEVERKKA